MFFADVERALTELRRVLRPEARACFAAWGPIEQPYWQTTMEIIRRHAGGTMLEPGGADPFRFSKAGSLSDVLRARGFMRWKSRFARCPGPGREMRKKPLSIFAR